MLTGRTIAPDLALDMKDGLLDYQSLLYDLCEANRDTEHARAYESLLKMVQRLNFRVENHNGVEYKTEGIKAYGVVITEVGAKMINVIKAIRSTNSKPQAIGFQPMFYGLKEAKDYVEAVTAINRTPFVVVSTWDEAEHALREVQAEGATARIIEVS